MKNALARLHRVIVDEIDPASGRDYTEDELQSLTAQCTNDCQLTHQWLLHQSIRLKSRKRLELLVHEYQCSFVQLLDRACYYQRQYPGHSLQALYKTLIRLLPDCLHQLQRRYRAYFDADEKAADIYVDVLQEELLPTWKRLTKALKKMGVEHLLVKLLADSINFLLRKHPGQFTSFREMGYIDELTRKLQVWAAADYPDVTGELVLFLLSFNFNCSAFIHFCYQYISRKAEDAVSEKDKLDRLWRYHHQIDYLPVKTGLVYDPCLPRVNRLVDDWLIDEIRQSERKLPAYSGNGYSRPNQEEDDKLTTVFSVPQLSAWARGSIDAGMFPEENVERLCRKLARVFRTRHQEHISPDSLQTKAYSLEKRNKEFVNEYLIKTFNCIKRY